MKKTLFWLALIVVTVALIGSCAKKDDSTAATDATGTGTGSTASGTISGIDYLTGTFHMSYNGQTPSGGCIDNSSALTALSAALPSGTLGLKWDITITSSTTWTKSLQWYSDASCATVTGYMNKLFKDIAVGDSLSGLTAGSMGLPTTAKKVSYKEESLVLKCNTDACTTFLNSTFGESSLATLGFTQGTELVVSNSDSEVDIWETVIPSGQTNTYLINGCESESTYPTNWCSGIDMWWK